MKLKVIYKNGVPFAVHNEKEYRFELEKDDWQSEIKKVFPRLYNSGMDKDFIRHTEDGFMEGYKAAQSKGCFTEEDMRKAFFNGGTFTDESDWNHYLQSIKQPKKLVAIEIEEEINESIEPISTGNYPHKDDYYYKAKFTKSEQYPDGLLTIKQYFYE